MITREAAIWGYRLILGREPEDQAVIDDAMTAADLEAYRQRLFSSAEFAQNNLGVGLPSRWVAAPIMGGRRLIWILLSDRFVSRGCLFDDYEPAETRFVRSFLREGDTFVDAGANVGWFTMLASTIVGSAGHIHAFEPRLQTGEYLKRTVALNGLQGLISVYDFGLSDAEGDAILAWSSNTDNPGGSHLATNTQLAGMDYQQVRLRPLDSLGLAGADFIKADVEGAELRVFKGARGTIERSRPVVLSELSPEMLQRVSGASADEFFEFFRTLGYRAFAIDLQRYGEELQGFPPDWPKPLINVGLVPRERPLDPLQTDPG
ncbi:MAG: FkbM family methyltransferase [Alphaproteobacteria bacterium]|nr:FkbM family methyltransferase [Alphaproteobacteria bacterium]